jgi:hypothetical protein
MKRFLGFLSSHKLAIAVSVLLLIAGAFFRWEVREVNDARTGQAITRYRGIVFPWQPCGATGNGTPINFRVRHWLCYGLVKLEATGTTM